MEKLYIIFHERFVLKILKHCVPIIELNETSALYHFTDLIWYVSSILSTDIQYILQYLSHCHQIGLCNQLTFVMLNGHFHVFILWSKHHIFCFQMDANYKKMFYLGKCIWEWLPPMSSQQEITWIILHCGNLATVQKRSLQFTFQQKSSFQHFTTEDVDFINF